MESDRQSIFRFAVDFFLAGGMSLRQSLSWVYVFKKGAVCFNFSRRKSFYAVRLNCQVAFCLCLVSVLVIWWDLSFVVFFAEWFKITKKNSGRSVLAGYAIFIVERLFGCKRWTSI